MVTIPGVPQASPTMKALDAIIAITSDPEGTKQKIADFEKAKADYERVAEGAEARIREADDRVAQAEKNVAAAQAKAQCILDQAKSVQVAADNAKSANEAMARALDEDHAKLLADASAKDAEFATNNQELKDSLALLTRREEVVAVKEKALADREALIVSKEQDIAATKAALNERIQKIREAAA